MLKVKPFRVVPSADNNRYYVRGPGGKGFGSFVSCDHAKEKCRELNAAFRIGVQRGSRSKTDAARGVGVRRSEGVLNWIR